MSKREPLIKELTSTGAVTTDNIAGVLHYVMFSGVTVGDKLEVGNGGTNVITMITSVANAPVYFDPPKDKLPVFTTDIAATITVTANGYATFIYEEIEI